MQGFDNTLNKQEAQIIAVERRSDGDGDDGAPFAASGHSPMLLGHSLAPLLLFAYRSTFETKKNNSISFL